MVADIYYCLSNKHCNTYLDKSPCRMLMAFVQFAQAKRLRNSGTAYKGGCPGRGWSRKSFMPLVAKRFRQKATVPGLMFNSMAISIHSAAKLLLDQQFWYDGTLFVEDIDVETGSTGPEKKAKVKADLIVVFGKIGNVLVDFAIGLGVLWLRFNGEAVEKYNNINDIGYAFEG